jgi:hypothetical protein
MSITDELYIVSELTPQQTLQLFMELINGKIRDDSSSFKAYGHHSKGLFTRARLTSEQRKGHISTQLGIEPHVVIYLDYVTHKLGLGTEIVFKGIVALLKHTHLDFVLLLGGGVVAILRKEGEVFVTSESDYYIGNLPELSSLNYQTREFPLL